MTRYNASILWNSIVEYAHATGELYAEGNSGEFSDIDEEQRLGRELLFLEKNLVKVFSESTGWTPSKVYVVGRTQEELEWILTEKKSK